MSLVHIDPTFLFYILLRPFFRLGKNYTRVILYNKYSFEKALITINPKLTLGFYYHWWSTQDNRNCVETCLQLQKNCLLWQFGDVKGCYYLIEDAGHEAETGTKRQNMSIREPGRQVWCMKINVCSKQINLIFFKKKTFSFNFRQQSVFSSFTPSLFSLSVYYNRMPLFYNPTLSCFSFHKVPLSLSLPISLCSFFKCLSLSALSPSLSLCVFLPPPQELNLW